MCQYVYLAGKLTISARCAPDVLQVGLGGVPAGGGVGSGTCSLRRVGGGAPVAFGCPACLWIIHGAIVARKAARHLILTKHYRVSLYHNLHLFVPRGLNTPLLFFLDLGVWFAYEIFRSSIEPREKPFWSFWPYSTPGACRTVPAVPNLLALPQLRTC